MEMIVSANKFGVTLIAPLVNFARLAVFMEEEHFRIEIFQRQGEHAGKIRGEASFSRQP